MPLRTFEFIILLASGDIKDKIHIHSMYKGDVLIYVDTESFTIHESCDYLLPCLVVCHLCVCAGTPLRAAIIDSFGYTKQQCRYQSHPECECEVLM